MQALDARDEWPSAFGVMRTQACELRAHGLAPGTRRPMQQGERRRDIGSAEIAVIDHAPAKAPRPGVTIEPLFRYRTLAILSPRHRLAGHSHLNVEDFADETLISYAVDDELLDVIRHFLKPASIRRHNAAIAPQLKPPTLIAPAEQMATAAG
ncbi:MAG: hypothetical protein C0434_12670 [Xanthomonadaceae bacterium]|nr:hypothetical protein [Xanthomonadaceae bacterium]